MNGFDLTRRLPGHCHVARCENFKLSLTDARENVVIHNFHLCGEYLPVLLWSREPSWLHVCCTATLPANGRNISFKSKLAIKWLIHHIVVVNHEFLLDQIPRCPIDTLPLNFVRPTHYWIVINWFEWSNLFLALKRYASTLVINRLTAFTLPVLDSLSKVMEPFQLAMNVINDKFRHVPSDFLLFVNRLISSASIR